MTSVLLALTAAERRRVRTWGLTLALMASSLFVLSGMGESAWAAADPTGQGKATSPTAREQAARAASEGWHLVEAGRFEAASTFFAQALRLVPDEPGFLVGLGLCYHRLHRDNFAAPLLQRAITLDPTAALADRILGDIYLDREEFQRAVEHYERALYQDPNDVPLRDRLLSARQAAQAEAQSSRIFSPHFVVRYPDAAHHRLAAQALAGLERAYVQVGDHLAYRPAEPLVVILYPRRQFVELTGSPHWAGGLFDGKLHLALESLQGTRESMQEAVTHEYTHAMVDQLSAGRAPAWLNEGLALELAARGRSGLKEEVESIRADLMPLRSLHDSFLLLPPAAVRIAYVESRAAVVDLIEHQGLDKVRRLLRTLARDQDFARAFETVMGISYQVYDDTWLGARAQGRL